VKHGKEIVGEGNISTVIMVSPAGEGELVLQKKTRGMGQKRKGRGPPLGAKDEEQNSRC